MYRGQAHFSSCLLSLSLSLPLPLSLSPSHSPSPTPSPSPSLSLSLPLSLSTYCVQPYLEGSYYIEREGQLIHCTSFVHCIVYGIMSLLFLWKVCPVFCSIAGSY